MLSGNFKFCKTLNRYFSCYKKFLICYDYDMIELKELENARKLKDYFMINVKIKKKKK